MYMMIKVQPLLPWNILIASMRSIGLFLMLLVVLLREKQSLFFRLPVAFDWFIHSYQNR